MNSYTNWNCSNFIDWDRNPVHNFIDFSSSSMPTTSLPSYPQFPDYPATEAGCLKREQVCFGLEEGNYGNGRIGLDLGHRKHFPSRETAVLNCLFKRSRRFYQVPRCQAKGCNVYLTNAKQYHRRHKVCEFHSKATKVLLADDGLEQRFCQQCSRFHVLAEFDETKRSCRKRLADHNRRRRKPQTGTTSNSEARKTAQNGEVRSQENTRAYSFSLLMTKDSKSNNVEQLQKVAVTQLQKRPALSLGGIEIFQRCLEPPNAVYTHQPFSSPSSFFERQIVSPSSSLIHNCCHSNPFSDALQSTDGGSDQTHHRHQQQQHDLQILMEVGLL